jgi:integrase/recombinase XerD
MVKRTRWSDMKKDSIPFKKLREQYAVYNKTAGKSARTVEWYEQKLELFERYLGPDACLADFTVPNVRGYIAELQERTQRNPNNKRSRMEGPLSSSYISGIVRGLRAFSTWLHEDGYTDTNVLKPIKPPKVQQKVKEVLTDDEVKRLISVFDQDEPYGARSYAAIWTFLDCGLRAAELCNLKMEDAHLEQGYLKVLGKGNKERLVPIGQSCQDALIRWRDRFRSQFEELESPYLFLNSNGRPFTVNALQQLLERMLSATSLASLAANPEDRDCAVRRCRLGQTGRRFRSVDSCGKSRNTSRVGGSRSGVESLLLKSVVGVQPQRKHG